jgi:hypothetical protein
MEFSHRKNYYVPGMETLFGENAIRINVTIEKEAIATTSKYRKLVIVVPRNIIFYINYI